MRGFVIIYAAVRLWDNHRLLEAEYSDLQAMLLKMGTFMNLNMEKRRKSCAENKNALNKA